MGQLTGRVAVITGGGSGIGKGIALAYAREGCAIVIAGRSAERLQSAAVEIQATGADILTVPTDVGDEAQVVALFQRTMQRFGRVDILVNSSGAFDGGRIDTLSLEAWRRVMDANVNGPFLCTREAFKIMKEQGGGRIVNIGSISAQRPRENSAPYSTSKFAIWGLTQCTALDGREFGIAVSCLHPGNTAVERRASGKASNTMEKDWEPLIATEDIARTALLMVTLPPESVMLEAIVMPVRQKYIGRG